MIPATKIGTPAQVMSSKGLNEGALGWLIFCINNFEGVGEKLKLVVSDVYIDDNFVSGTFICQSSADRCRGKLQSMAKIKTIFLMTKQCVC